MKQLVTDNELVRLSDFLSYSLNRSFVWGETHCSMLICRAWDYAKGNQDYKNYHEQNFPVDSLEKAKELCAEKNGLVLLDYLGYEEIENGWRTGDVLYLFKDEIECMHIYTDGKLISSFIDGKVTAVNLYHVLKIIEQDELEFKVFRKQ
tara:strand:- start:4982 stop:5428 length:447 start_codon:yes stop_codon:yes gene_type:complete